MHPINRNKLLRHGIWDAVLVRARARDTRDDLARLGDTADHLGESLTGQTPPVRLHADLQGWVREDGRSPLDRVDLGHQGAVDQPGCVEDFVPD